MKATRPNSLNRPFRQVLMACVAWMATAAMAATNTLSNVSVSEGQNQSQVIKFVLKEAVKDMPVSFTTSNPHRLVLDFANTDSNLGRVQESLNAGGIKNYQVVQSGDRTRVVFSLTGPGSHELRKDKNVVLAVLQVAQAQTASATPAEAVPVRFAETGKVKDHGIKDVDFRRGKNGEGRLAITLSDPGVGIDIQQKGKSIQIDFLNTSLPGPLQRRMDVTDFATPTQMVEMFEQGKNTRMLVTPKGKWDYSAYQTGNQFIMEVRPVDESSLAKGDKPIYTGEKLTLNFQNVEVRSVLQVIADFTSLNIIASDTVAGNLTLRLKDVPWDQALDIILRSKGLDKRASGNVIWVAPRDELMAKEKAELEARQQINELEELVTEVIPLNYLRAPDAYAMLLGKSITATQAGKAVTCATSAEGVGGRTENVSGSTGASASTGNVNSMLSKRGTANFDLKTNTLFVQDTPARLVKIRKLLSEIDNPARQVMIEARVVLADEGFGRTLGARLGVRVTGQLDGAGLGLSSTGIGAASMATSGTLNTTPSPYNVDLPGKSLGDTSPSTLGFSILNAASTVLIGLELQALEADNRGKIVSNPRVITQNQQPAVILTGQQIPYTTANAAGSTATNTTEFVDALLCLLVDPQILNNDDVVLDVEVQKDAPGVSTSGAPPIDRRRVKTQVRVKSGETVVLGGIYEQTTRNDTDKVPFLGDLPILGYLFRNNYKIDEKTEMLIFLTPRILDETLTALK